MTAVLRELLAQVAIIIALCIGGWALLVQPRVAALREVEEKIAQSKAAGTPGYVAAVTQIARQASTIRQRVADAQARNAVATDTSALYRRVMDLARQTNVTVQTLRPRQAGEPRSGESVAVAQVEMTVEGTYEELARFFEAVESIPGFVRPASLRIAPSDGPTQPPATASYAFEALRFPLPQELAAFQGGRDAIR